MFARYYAHPRDVAQTIELVGLGPQRHARVGSLSGGQKRRVDVALGLVGDPELLFLDEPTTGFDPQARRDAWKMIEGLRDLGKTVFLTTHYMDEAQYLADRVAVIAAGRIVAEGPPATLGDRQRARATVRYRLPSGISPPAGFGGPPGPDGFTKFVPDDLTSALSQLTGWAIGQRISLDGLDIVRPSLEDVYLALTGSAEGSGAE
jgi:ABC-2 type transport system ATP-binding protein